MNFGLSEEIINKINNVFKKYDQILEVKIYGSRAMGTYKKGSDIDLTLIGSNIDLKLINKISNELDDLNLPYTFDLSIFAKIDNKDFIDHINKVGILFYSKFSNPRHN